MVPLSFYLSPNTPLSFEPLFTLTASQVCYFSGVWKRWAWQTKQEFHQWVPGCLCHAFTKPMETGKRALSVLYPTEQHGLHLCINLVGCIISDALSVGQNSHAFFSLHKVPMSFSTQGEKRLCRSGWADLSYQCSYPCVQSEKCCTLCVNVPHHYCGCLRVSSWCLSVLHKVSQLT